MTHRTMNAAQLEAAAALAEDEGRWTDAAALWHELAERTPAGPEHRAWLQSAEEAEERLRTDGRNRVSADAGFTGDAKIQQEAP